MREAPPSAGVALFNGNYRRSARSRAAAGGLALGFVHLRGMVGAREHRRGRSSGGTGNTPPHTVRRRKSR